ncbi:YhgE/Pip domain-containing protein [Promicromonospora sukumoe]|uniref:YhgE/Pip domain-containing protein n=1 Tax=Promicromonospora sukumoe TaxID=88382 RepID=UPI0003817264|nr:YhgE/Pip domain-containing protein [Promicromonospora sukumoe]
MTTANKWLRPEPFRNPWRAVAVALLPLMILGLLISALWNPQDRLDTVKAAIVNLDEPVEVQGQTVPLGRQLAAGLVSGGETADAAAGEAAAIPASDASYDWEISDEETAAAGLADGTYAAVITIPEDFSAAATSFSGDDPDKAEQATIDVATAPDGRVLDDALAQVVAQTATGVLGSTLTETYVDNVLVGFSTLSEELGKAADGASQLADGANEAGKGAQQLADGAGELADGATEAGKGAQQLAEGAHQTSDGVSGVGAGVSSLAGGAGQWASGADQWAAGADQAAAGVNQLAAGAGQSAAGASDLASGADDLATGAKGVDKGAKALAGGLAETSAKLEGTGGTPGPAAAATQLASGASEVSGGVSDLVDGMELACATPSLDPRLTALCDQLPELKKLEAGSEQVAGGISGLAGTPGAKPTGLYELTAGISGLAGGGAELAGYTGQVSSGASQLADGTHQLAGGLDELSTGADQAAGGVSELSAGARELSTGAGGISSGANQLATGANQLAAGSSQLATGVDGLAGGVTELGSGTSQLATGVGGLADGVGELAGGAQDLSDGLGQATEEIPSYTEQERKSLASVVADPVATDGEVTDLNTGATGPMFAVLALWLGALALMIVFPPVPLRARGSTRGALRLTLGTFVVPAAIGLGTGLATGAILAGLEGLGVGGWLATMGFGALVSVAFVAVNQALAAALGHVGRGISLLVAVLVIATGVVSTAPSVLEGLAGFLPVGPSLAGLVRLVEPGTGGVAMATAAVVLWAVAGITITALMVARERTVRAADLLRTA